MKNKEVKIVTAVAAAGKTARRLAGRGAIVPALAAALMLSSGGGWATEVSDPAYARPASHVVAVPAQVGEPPAPVFDPRQYGAKGDGVTYDTAALQKAIDACAGTGGSVVLSAGNYVSKPLTLRGRMTFFLQKGAVLLGSTNLADYPVLLPDYLPRSALCRSVLYASDADGLILDGEGVIDGRCKEMNMPAELRKGGTERQRPSLLRIFRSRNVTVRNVTFRNPCMWTQIYSDCDQLLIDHVTVDAPPDCANLDGMDICDSFNVIVRNCDIRAEDDCICLKSHNARGLKNIRIENNRIHCYRANAIKLGTATKGPIANIEIVNNLVTYAKYGGLCIESVDGSDIRNFVVRDLDMYRVNDPIFVRLANRSGAPGSLTDVLIENVRAYETGLPDGDLPRNMSTPPACTITGIPQSRIGTVRLKNCYIEMPGGLAKMPPAPPEKEKAYPQSNLFGAVPAYGLYVRHADNVVLDEVYFGRYAPDARPWLKADDAKVQVVASQDLELIRPAKTAVSGSTKE